MQFSIFRKVAWHFYGEKCGAKQARVKSEIVKTEQESMSRKIATLSSIVAPPGLVNKFRLICRRYFSNIFFYSKQVSEDFCNMHETLKKSSRKLSSIVRIQGWWSQGAKGPYTYPHIFPDSIKSVFDHVLKPLKGLFTFYVDKILGFFDPSLPLHRQFIY